MIVAKNEKMEILKDGRKNPTAVTYKQGFWCWKRYCHILKREIKLKYLKEWCKKTILLILKQSRKRKCWFISWNSFFIRLQKVKMQSKEIRNICEHLSYWPEKFVDQISSPNYQKRNQKQKKSQSIWLFWI